MLDYGQIPKLVANLPEAKLFELFKINRNNLPQQEIEPFEKSDTNWKNREQVYRRMFRQRLIGTAFDEPTALKFLHDYYEIRRERNQINHANAKASKTVAEIKPMIENYLVALERAST